MKFLKFGFLAAALAVSLMACSDDDDDDDSIAGVDDDVAVESSSSTASSTDSDADSGTEASSGSDSSASEDASSDDSECTAIEKDTLALSTYQGTLYSAYNFETETSDDPHVTISYDEDAFYFEAGDDVTFWEEDDPSSIDDPSCLEAFTTAYNSSSTKVELMTGTYIIIVTSDATYPVYITKVKATGEEGEVTIEMNWWKVSE